MIALHDPPPLDWTWVAFSPPRGQVLDYLVRGAIPFPSPEMAVGVGM